MIANSREVLRVGDFILRADSGYSAIGEDRHTVDGEAGVLTLAAVSTGTFRPRKHKAVTGSEIAKLQVFPKKDRILISRSNTPELVGAVVYVPDDYPNLFLPDLIWQLEPKHDCHVSMPWFSYFLQSSYGRAKIRKIAVGSSGSMVKIGKQAFLNIELSVPPLPEQRKIAAILGTWDAAISSAEKLAAVLQERKRGLMQRLLTGQVRFPEFADSPWDDVRLGDVFTERRETGRTDLSLLSITSKQGVIPRDSVDRRDTSSEDKSKYLRICKGDLGYNTMRMWQGVSALSSLEGIVSPAYTICTPKETVAPCYMSYLFKFPPVIHLFWRYSQGLVDDTLSLKYDAFSRVKVTLPHLAEQRRIATVLQLCDSEIGVLERKIVALKRQKQGLMQRLLSGQVRVRVDEDDGHADGDDGQE